MKLTKKVIAGVLIAGFLATFLVVPQAAEAGGRHWNHGGGTTATHHGHHGGTTLPSGADSRWAR